MEDLNNTIEQLDLRDIHRKLHLIMAEYKFFSNSQGTFFWIDHMLGHKKILNNSKRLKSYQIYFIITMK